MRFSRKPADPNSASKDAPEEVPFSGGDAVARWKAAFAYGGCSTRTQIVGSLSGMAAEFAVWGVPTAVEECCDAILDVQDLWP